MDCKNLFHLPSTPLDEEWIDTLVDNPTLRIERIISTGQTSSWYCQQEHEFVSLLQGEAELEWEDGTKTHLVAGDTLTIPAHISHRVSYTSSQPPCVWLCIFWS